MSSNKTISRKVIDASFKEAVSPLFYFWSNNYWIEPLLGVLLVADSVFFQRFLYNHNPFITTMQAHRYHVLSQIRLNPPLTLVVQP